MKNSISKKIIGGVLGVAFVLAAFFGVHLSMVHMNSQNTMQNCPLLDSMKSICTMTATEHIAKWRQLFAAAMQSNKFLFTPFLLMGFAFAVFSFQFSSHNRLHFQTIKSRAGPPEYSSGFLLGALGRGILRKKE